MNNWPDSPQNVSVGPPPIGGSPAAFAPYFDADRPADVLRHVRGGKAKIHRLHVAIVASIAFTLSAETLTLHPTKTILLPPNSTTVFMWDAKNFGVLNSDKRTVTLFDVAGTQQHTITLGNAFQPLASPPVFPHIVIRANGLYWITNRGEIARYNDDGTVAMTLDLKASTFWATPTADGEIDVLVYDVKNTRYDVRTYTPQGILKAAVPVPPQSEALPDIDRAFFFHVPTEARVPVYDTTVTIGNHRVDYLRCATYPSDLRQVASNAIAMAAQALRTPEPIALAAGMTKTGALNIVTNGGALVHIDNAGTTTCTELPPVSAPTFVTTSVAQVGQTLATITQVGPKTNKRALLRIWTLDVEK